MYDVSQVVVKLGMHYIGDGADEPDDAQMTRRISRMTIHKAYNTRNTVSFVVDIIFPQFNLSCESTSLKPFICFLLTRL